MLNVIRDNLGARKKFKALGRGIGSGKGKTCGRGGKGQTARSGVAIKGFEGGQMSLIRRLPKRGFNSINKEVFEVLNFRDIESFIERKILSKKITLNDLREKGLLKGINKKVKLLGTGEIKTKFEIEVNAISDSAQKKVDKAGCSVKLVDTKEKKVSTAKVESKKKNTKDIKKK